MRRSFSATCLVVTVICAFLGCNATKKDEATKSSVQTNTANAEPNVDESQHQFRAVCIDKEMHGGNEYVLSKWLDRRDKADELAQYHGNFKYAGHRWRIDERVRPERVKPK